MESRAGPGTNFQTFEKAAFHPDTSPPLLSVKTVSCRWLTDLGLLM